MSRASTGRSWFASAVLLAVLAVPSVARAHQGSIAYSDVTVSADHRRVDYRLRLNALDLGEPLGVDLVDPATPEQIRAGAGQIFDYVLGRIQIDTGDMRCQTRRGPVKVIEQNDRFAELHWSVVCPRPLRELAIEYHLFFDIDPTHSGNLHVRADGEDADTVIQTDARRFVWPLDGETLKGWSAFARLGTTELFGGEHLAFLLGLVLMLILARPGTGSWTVRPRPEVIRGAAVLAVAFATGASLTTVAATLGWIDLPAGMVRSMVALSVIYVAVDNLGRPDPQARPWLALSFGAMHGLTLAALLAIHLPDGAIGTPLVAFAIGVALGTVVLLAGAGALVREAVARWLGTDDYRRIVVPLSSVALGLLGVAWLLQYALGVAIL